MILDPRLVEKFMEGYILSEVIGLIGAMDEEIELLLNSMENKQTTVKAGINYYSGDIFGKPAVLCKSGVGKV
ncbi:5'-methylthioadenosine/S-adenosylhomocysteine nucleosidase [compost metagenome]